MSMISDLLTWLGNTLLEAIKAHPYTVFVAILFLVRQFGTTVQSGSRGVLFVFGRARKELEPGFHPLLPVVHRVRMTPVRSITLDLPNQRVTTADGLVYDVQANLVYRVAQPITSMVQIDNVRKGIIAVLATVVQEMLRVKSRAELVARTGLDEEFRARTEGKLVRWGVVVEQAGFKSIAPTSPTLRLTQMRQRVAEREEVLRHFLECGLSPETAVALLGTEQRCLSHAAHRYRSARHRAALRRKRHLRLWPPEPASVVAPRNAKDQVPGDEAGSSVGPQPPTNLSASPPGHTATRRDIA